VRGPVAAACQATAVRRLGALPTAAISDALDREGIPGALKGLAPLSNDVRVAGPAFTVQYAPAGSANQIVAAVRAGSTLRQARETFGYHHLQQRRS